MNVTLDYQILKAIISSQPKALEFASSFDKQIFLAPVREHAALILEYIVNFRSVPTKRTFLEKYGKTPELSNTLSIFFDEVIQTEYDINDYSYDLGLLKERYKSRIVESLKKSFNTNNDTEELLHEAKLRIHQAQSINSGRAHIQISAGDYADQFLTSYEARKNDTDARLNIKTGYSIIDWATSGLLPSEMLLVGAATGGGKSLLLNNMAVNMWRQQNNLLSHEFSKGFSVLYFSLEMPYQDCYDRFLACFADVPQRSLTEGRLDSYEEEKVKKALDFIKKYQDFGCHYQIVDVPRGVTAEQIELRYEEALLKFRPDIVVVDYLGLMHSDSKEADWLKLANIAGQLHEIARNYNCVMLSALQLTDIKRNKTDKEQSDRVGSHRIGRSSLILHHANFFLQIESRDNERQLPDLPLHWVKNRRGPMASINLIKSFENSRILDVPFLEGSDPADISTQVSDLIKGLKS